MPLSTPVLTVTPDTAVAAYNLSVTVPSGATAMTVRRYHPSGVVVPVRGAYLAEPPALGPFTVVDNEPPIGVSVTYRAFASNATEESQSAMSTSYELDITDTWLVDLWAPGNSVKVNVEAILGLDYGIDEQVMYPLMRRTPVVVQNVRRAASGSLQFTTDTEDEARRVRMLFSMGVPVLFQSPMSYGVGNLYLSASKVAEERLTRLASDPTRRWKVEWAEVERPNPEWVLDLDSLGFINYGDAYDLYIRYSTLATANEDYDTLRLTRKGEVGLIGGFTERPDLTWRGD